MMPEAATGMGGPGRSRCAATLVRLFPGVCAWRCRLRGRCRRGYTELTKWSKLGMLRPCPCDSGERDEWAA